MFVWTISEVIGLVINGLIWSAVIGIVLFRVIRQARCRHTKVFENGSCDAICRQCGKNLGFIGAWRERNSYEP